MKAVEERAKELLYAIKYADTESECLSRIIVSLKEQDKFTRHACAENVTEIMPPYGQSIPKIDRDRIHNAIMNTKAV
jgi:hypothetical protein